MRLYAHPKYTLEVIYSDTTQVHYELEKMQTNDDAEQLSSGVIDLFVDAIKTDNKTILDGDEALESMKVVFACLKSSQSGTLIQL